MIFSRSARSSGRQSRQLDTLDPSAIPATASSSPRTDGSHLCRPHTLVAARPIPGELQLRGLLIRICGLLGKFDGEQRLHAGVHVEGLTGPAGPDGLGVGMLEAVHGS